VIIDRYHDHPILPQQIPGQLQPLEVDLIPFGADLRKQPQQLPALLFGDIQGGKVELFRFIGHLTSPLTTKNPTSNL